MNYIEELRATILNLHGAEAEHVETVPITEMFNDEIVWEGEVEVFDLRGHPKAKRAYGWGHVNGEDDQARRYVTVLHLPPVDSPRKAVQASIASDYREQANAES